MANKAQGASAPASSLRSIHSIPEPELASRRAFYRDLHNERLADLIADIERLALNKRAQCARLEECGDNLAERQLAEALFVDALALEALAAQAATLRRTQESDDGHA
jgi:hypothetical protein